MLQSKCFVSVFKQMVQPPIWAGFLVVVVVWGEHLKDVASQQGWPKQIISCCSPYLPSVLTPLQGSFAVLLCFQTKQSCHSLLLPRNLELSNPSFCPSVAAQLFAQLDSSFFFLRMHTLAWILPKTYFLFKIGIFRNSSIEVVGVIEISFAAATWSFVWIGSLLR